MGRPADYLPSGTVGQWLPAPCNGGPTARAATRKPTRRGRLGPRAGIPKRTRPNCHQTGYSRTSVDCINKKRGGGPKTPVCAGEGTQGPWVAAHLESWPCSCEGTWSRLGTDQRQHLCFLPQRHLAGKRVSVCLSMDLAHSLCKPTSFSFGGPQTRFIDKVAESPGCASVTWYPQCYFSEERRDPTDAVLGQVGDIRCCSTTGAWS